MPTRDNRYQLPSWPPTEFTIDLWNETFGDLADRIAAREDLEASFETLMAQGIQASLDYIQVNVAPQIATLQQSISLAQQQIDQIIVGGTAPNALKLGGREAAWYASAQAVQDAMQNASEAVDTKLADYLRTDQKNVADGVAPLGPDSKVPQANLPALTTTATVGAAIAGANGLATPDDGDALAGTKSGTSTMFRWTWGNIKAALDALYYRKAAVDTALAGKVAKAGDTMTGNLTISNGGPWIHLHDADNGQTRKVHHNDGYIGFVGHAPSDWLFRVNDAGAVWTSQLGDLNTRIEDRAYAHADARAWAVANDRVANLNSRWVSRGEQAARRDLWWEVPAGSAMTGLWIQSSNSAIMHYCWRYFQLFDPVRGWITAHNA
ncbi:hypothetical protein [Rhizobium sp. AN70]|uniref:hypothetical protein n=2 Tax=unclassified Rhizobium TaxID=2613769 RepID=UPI0024786246|nr:hypothetical protein [Rhizobium sp. AN70]MDH7802232.1 putative DNA-binding transcriptional regulator AlpA [Rhizobium sp. AN70]